MYPIHCPIAKGCVLDNLEFHYLRAIEAISYIRNRRQRNIRIENILVLTANFDLWSLWGWGGEDDNKYSDCFLWEWPYHIILHTRHHP